MFTLDGHGCADSLCVPCDHALLFFFTGCAQQFIQLFQIACLRQRHQRVPPEVSLFALHAALFVAARRITEIALETPVRAEGKEPLRLLALVPAQNLLPCTRQVVVSEHLEGPAEIPEGRFVRVQKRLLRGVRIGLVKRTAAGHRPHTEDEQLLSFPAQFCPGLVPIHLSFPAPPVTLRYEGFPCAQPHLPFALANVSPY